MQETNWILRTDRQIEPPATALELAIVQTAAYSDIFDYPLSAVEIHRYLIEVTATREAVDTALAGGCLAPGRLASRDGYFALAGRDQIVSTRQQRERESERLWHEALRYGRIIASLPFVRMLAITGELAMDNVQPTSDIDYFIVTKPGRLWLCRLVIIGVVRYAAFRGVTVCPNYLLSEDALTIHERNLYAAHEVAQMVPITGHALYERFRELNAWVADYLPNAAGPPRQMPVRPYATPVRRLAERVLGTHPGGWIERWEMNRKLRKLSRTAGHVPEASFGPDWCKGHVSGHEGRILAAFDDRRRALEEGTT